MMHTETLLAAYSVLTAIIGEFAMYSKWGGANTQRGNKFIDYSVQDIFVGSRLRDCWSTSYPSSLRNVNGKNMPIYAYRLCVQDDLGRHESQHLHSKK